jgi:hypothetical protein
MKLDLVEHRWRTENSRRGKTGAVRPENKIEISAAKMK